MGNASGVNPTRSSFKLQGAYQLQALLPSFRKPTVEGNTTLVSHDQHSFQISFFFLFSSPSIWGFFLSFFQYMKAIFTAKAVLSKMQWLWLILSQPYYLAARWSAVLKWIMNPWNWLSVTFIILMERQVRSGLTTSHANETTTVTSACLKAFICLERKVMP